MATSYGRLRFEILKVYPGTDLDTINGFAWDRYQQILSLLDWERLSAQSAFATPASYATGTVAVTNGSDSIVGTGTTWTEAMTNRMIRFAGQSEYYNFTFVDATHGTLDRVYAGTTAAAATFRIDQNVYALPATLRTLDSLEIPGCGPLHLASGTDFDSDRMTYGQPAYYALHMDTVDDVPQVQVELWPVPERVYTVNYRWHKDVSNPTGSTQSSILPWINNGALKYGVLADIATLLEKPQQATSWETRFLQLVNQLVAQNSRVEGGRVMRTASRFTRHRVGRWRG